MRLERLEINGFKSFSDRTELAFDRGVTAIVGPNGCGKSNVVDAVAWVLGEQSAKSLRGERMEDVIFGGSDGRKPTGAAEVRLMLSGARAPRNGGHEHGGPNGDRRAAASNGGNGHGAPAAALLVEEEQPAEDVQVTRRLYRSGESEYLINGEVCRLREVHDLFIDAGVGVKAYAFIEQGKVGAMLSARPQERRQIIEEAAGVTKYKTRRRAAELKLEAARQNLTRIDDIVFELEKQLGSLRRQAAKARRYKKLREELRRWEKALFARRYRALRETIETARARLGTARAQETQAAERIAELEADLGLRRDASVCAEARAAALRQSVHVSELDVQRLEHQLEADHRQAALLETRGDEAAREVEQLGARRDPAAAALAARRAGALEARAEADRAAAAATDVDAEHARAQERLLGLDADVEAARSEVFASIHAASALRHALEHAARAREKTAARLAELEVEAASLRVELARAETGRQAALHALGQAAQALDAARRGRAAREAELAALTTALEDGVNALRAEERELAALGARSLSLEELAAARAGFGDAARLALSESGGRIAHLGAAADYLEVDSRYERAVEASLGDMLQYVIVESAAHADAGLAFVREQGAGRCGFLILDAPPKPVASGPNGAVSLLDAITVTGPHASAIRAALPAVYFAEGPDAAAEMAAVAPGPVATLDGHVFHGPQMVAGGAQGDDRGLLAAKREIKELRQRVDAAHAVVAGLTDQTSLARTRVAQAALDAAALATAEHDQEKAIVGHEGCAVRAAADAERLRRTLEQAAVDRRKAEAERAELDAREVDARASIAQLEGEQRLADERLAAAQRRLFEAREGAEALGRRRAETRASHAALIERVAAGEADARRLEEALHDLDARIEAGTAARDEMRARAHELVDAMAAARTRLGEARASLDAHGSALADVEAQALARRQEAIQHEAEIRDARVQLDARRAATAALDLQRASAESELTHLAQASVDALQATLDEVEAEALQLGDRMDAPAVLSVDDDEGEDLAEPQDAAPLAPWAHVVTAEDAIAALKLKIERLGPVNMMAIEQFDDLDERQAFLTAQRKDVVESIATTDQAIKKIDETTVERFREAFAVINANFQETFTALFGGGHAGLTLLDDADLLESGVDIIAQPPGKRLQNVQLLSGGEKAMTAIALMFALFKYRPSPFCLLDEIDAPLDDANINRFIQMLQGLQTKTQFILVTHNRKTMEIADRLYGVTMEEPGVSKLVSINLN